MLDAGIISLLAFRSYRMPSSRRDLTSTPHEACASCGCSRMVSIAAWRAVGAGLGRVTVATCGERLPWAQAAVAASAPTAPPRLFCDLIERLDDVVEVGGVDLRCARLAGTRHEDVVACLTERRSILFLAFVEF